MSNFYELSSEFVPLAMELENPDLEESDFNALMDRLNSVALEAEAKCCSVAGWIKSLEAVEDARRVEIQRLQAMNGRDKRLQEGLKSLLKLWLKATGQKTLKTKLATITLRKASTQTVVDASKVYDWPPEVFEEAIRTGAVVEEPVVNKTLLKKLPDWQKLPGVSELEGQEGLIIK